eukprot:GCRY01000216.1.p1 GENE.GCRY01000216.1~~GCRY01000216.1.p1  ORF type:complete len:420 (+),score=58.07 GCRY01000216.1:234-1493(+)
MSDGPWYHHTPMPVFALNMGLGGLTLVFKKAEGVFLDPEGPDEYGWKTLAIFNAVHFGVFLLLLCVRAIANWKGVMEDWRHPIRANFFPALSINFLLFSIAVADVENGIADVLFWIGTCLQVFFGLALLGRWWEKDIVKPPHCNPTCLIPVVGLLLIALAGAKVGSKAEIAHGFFGIALLFWIVMFGNMFHRLVFADRMAPKLTPSLFILIAPPAIFFITYAELNHSLDTASRSFYYLALFFFFLLMRTFSLWLPAFSTGKFQMPWVAFAFPLDSLAISSLDYFRLLRKLNPNDISKEMLDFNEVIAWIFFILAAVVVTLIYFAFWWGIFTGCVFVPEKEPKKKGPGAGGPQQASQPQKPGQPQSQSQPEERPIEPCVPGLQATAAPAADREMNQLQAAEQRPGAAGTNDEPITVVTQA